MMNVTHDTSLVRWIFQRGAQIVTCRVDRDATDSSYITAIVPHGKVELMAVGRFKTGMRALQQHASIAARLRQLGWTLIEYSRSESLPEAA